MAKEDQQKLKENPPAVLPMVTATASHDNNDLYTDPSPAIQVQHTIELESSDPASPASPTSPSSSKGFKSLFSKLKRHSKHSPTDEEEGKETGSGFIGGASLHSSNSNAHQQTSKAVVPVEHDGDEGMRPTNLGDVEPADVPHADSERYSDVSSLPSDDFQDASAVRGRPSGGNESDEAKDKFDASLAPPPTFTSDAEKARKAGSPTRDSKFHEIGI